uniref:Uncharacterized protein n=1 Tax=Plectus sambesii TaxID=2011161 RepID=A0A914WXH8_9BILA
MSKVQRTFVERPRVATVSAAVPQLLEVWISVPKRFVSELPRGDARAMRSRAATHGLQQLSTPILFRSVVFQVDPSKGLLFTDMNRRSAWHA